MNKVSVYSKLIIASFIIAIIIHSYIRSDKEDLVRPGQTYETECSFIDLDNPNKNKKSTKYYRVIKVDNGKVYYEENGVKGSIEIEAFLQNSVITKAK